MNTHDAVAVFRSGLAEWWQSQSTLDPLGPVAMRDDDGSPASRESELPNTTIRLAVFSRGFTTNMGREYEGGFTVEVHHGSMEQCQDVIEPLDVLFEAMIRGELFDLPRGYLLELEVVRSRMTQIDSMLWRADRECLVRLVLPQ